MKYLKSLTIKICVIAAALFLASPTMAANTNERGKTEKLVYQDSDPTKENYFDNRLALVGPGCMINSLFVGVKVVSGTKELQKILDEDLDNYATIPALVDATVGASPIISVKDNQHYYAGGIEAGFVICAESDASILSLDLAKFYKIQFLKDGKKVGNLQSISTGMSVTGLELSLGSSDQVNTLYMAKAPGDFDEIKLVQCGVDVKLGNAINIKYAFVGKAREYTITNNKENGIDQYAKGRKKITLDCEGYSHLWSKKENVIDEDLTNSFDINGLNLLGVVHLGSRPIKVIAKPSDNREAFYKYTEVGFRYASSALLNLNLGKGIRLTFFNKEGREIAHKVISTTVLSLGLNKKSTEAELVMKAPCNFSAVKLSVEGLNADLGGTNKVYYAFVRMAPDLATHHCDIEATASYNVCGCDNEFRLFHNEEVRVTWSLVSQPADSNIWIDAQTGKVENIYVPGDYTFMATADDGCTETTTIHYAPYYDPAEHGVTLLTNNASETKYELSGNNGGALLQLFGGIENASNVLNSSLNDYASVKAGVSLAENTGIIGIKSVDKSALNKNIDKTHKMQAGFVVTLNSTMLNLKAFNLYNIQLYKDGKKVAGGVATHWGAISAGLIGSEDTQKIRMSIDVPAGTDFDEIVLFNSGVINANLAKPNIYYAYVCDDEKDNASNNALYGTELVSMDGTDASIDWYHTNIFSLANIGNGLDGISNLIDNSIETGLTFPLGLSADGANVAVNVGKGVAKGQKIIMVSEDKELGLGIKLIKAIKLITYLNGQEMEELTDWKVLGADVIGTGGKQYATLRPKRPFNQVRLTVVGGLNLADNIKVYGLALGSDINEDGTSTDCNDEYLVLDEDETLDEKETLNNATMVFHRTFTTGKWNSLILPVDMTADQVTAAFGKDTKLAKFDKYDENWIYFSPVEESDAYGNILKANIPYIINPTKQPDSVNRNYNVGSGKEKHIDGPVYTVTGIYYGGQPTEMKCEDTGSSTNTGMTHYGSYEYRQEVPAKSYMLSKGDMVHTSKVHNVKSYRSWLEETTPSEKTLQLKVSDSDNSTTGIKVIEEAPQNANAVYNVNGMRMNSSNTDNLPKGVYIINNKKVVKK